MVQNNTMPPERVTTLADETLDNNQTSLREAIIFAAPGSVITFEESLRGILTLNEKLFLDKDITIFGSDAAQVRIQGDGSFDMFLVDGGANVELSTLTLFGGSDGIQVDDGSLSVSNSVIEYNTDDGIDLNADNSSLTVRDVIFRDTEGNGIELDGNNNQVNIIDSGFIDNKFNGIFLRGDDNTVEVNNSVFNNNGSYGVALADGNTPELTAENNTLTIIDNKFDNNTEDDITGGDSTNILIKDDSLLTSTPSEVVDSGSHMGISSLLKQWKEEKHRFNASKTSENDISADDVVGDEVTGNFSLGSVNRVNPFADSGNQMLPPLSETSPEEVIQTKKDLYMKILSA
jgi:CSLREA domain-containing protein